MTDVINDAKHKKIILALDNSINDMQISNVEFLTTVKNIIINGLKFELELVNLLAWAIEELPTTFTMDDNKSSKYKRAKEIVEQYAKK